MSARVEVRRLGISELERRLGVERTTIWRWTRSGRLPAPHYLGMRRVWFENDIAAWEAAQMERSAHMTRKIVAKVASKVDESFQISNGGGD